MDNSSTDTRERRESLASEVVELLNLGRSSRQLFSGADMPAELRESERLSRAVTEHIRALGDQTRDMVRVYADYWTAAELERLLAFYRSDLGVRFRAFLPVYAAEMAKLAAAVYQTRATEIKDIMSLGRVPPNPTEE